MIVDEVMTREPYAAKVTDSIRRVLHMLIEADVRHIPVVDEGALVGIVSDRDLRGLMPIEHEVGAVPVVEPDSSKLVGIVTYVDALRVARDEL